MNTSKTNHLIKQGALALTAAGMAPMLSMCGGQGGTDEQTDKNSDGDKAKEKPNIVIIYTDQQQWDALSAAGNEWLSTPGMDRIAGMGVMFEQSICNSPVSGPSRACLITGRMASESNMRYNYKDFSPKVPTMGEIFRDAGYETIWAGKWHVPEFYPARRGMKEVIGFDVLPFYDSTVARGYWVTGEFADSALTPAVNEYLRKDHEKPFLLFISYHNPHDICGFPYGERWKKRSENIPEDQLPPLPDNYNAMAGEPEFMAMCREREHYGGQTSATTEFDDEMWQRYIWSYYRMTEMVDKEIVSVLNTMKEEGLMDNTIIVFTTDHGETGGSHRFACKLNLWEEAIRVPLIVAYPGEIPAGKVDKKNLTQSFDIIPTLCDYAGIDCPGKGLGMSLRPIIDDPQAEWRDFVVAEVAPDNKREELKGRMIRTLDWKYNVYSHGEKNEQLFDLKNDPGETTNLAYDPEYAEVKAKLRQQLKDYLQEIGNDFEFKQ